MGIRFHKPTTSSQRGCQSLTFSEITRSRPEKSLVAGHKRLAGRGNGCISVRRRGGGHKVRYRFIDFKRGKYDVPARVVSIEYDPCRTAFIALISYLDGEKSYILWPKGLLVDSFVVSGEAVPIEIGNSLPLERIPVGRIIHNVELQRGKGGQIVRSAGASAVLVAIDGDYASLRLPSGEVRLVHKRCFATLGEIGNAEHANIKLGKAGRNRWKGNRPKVRGVAMNPVDHPLGGGEGRSSGGRHPVTPWGVPTKGYKTRKKNKRTDRFIIKGKKRF